MTSPLRADAARNRESLLAVAGRAFAAAPAGAEPSMRAIAREAGVGVGTLYRHFPTREALVDAVYRDQVQRLTNGAQELLAAHPPVVAMRRWMDLFAEWVATKSGMLSTVLAMVESGELPHDRTRAELRAALASLHDAGRTAGDLRGDVGVDDVLAGLVGILTATPGDPAQAERLLDVLMDGLTAPRP